MCIMVGHQLILEVESEEFEYPAHNNGEAHQVAQLFVYIMCNRECVSGVPLLLL